MTLSLVILAAGSGSRFGGDKPLAKIGPAGQSLFEYSVYDAVQAGISHIVFVVNERQDISVFENRLLQYGSRLKIDFVVQSIESNIASSTFDVASLGRVKPWGTGHAVLATQGVIRNPFVVINADDYYGRENFDLIGRYLQEHANNPQSCALPGYRLSNTLSLSGSVNRGICQIDSDGYLISITEIKDITYDRSQLYSVNNIHTETLTDESIVSMTFWGFQPSIFQVLNTGFTSFLARLGDVKSGGLMSGDLQNSEFYIPEAIDSAVKSGALKVRVFPTREKWKGLTYAGDIEEVRTFIAGSIERGQYANLQSPRQ